MAVADNAFLINDDDPRRATGAVIVHQGRRRFLVAAMPHGDGQVISFCCALDTCERVYPEPFKCSLNGNNGHLWIVFEMVDHFLQCGEAMGMTGGSPSLEAIEVNHFAFQLFKAQCGFSWREIDPFGHFQRGRGLVQDS